MASVAVANQNASHQLRLSRPAQGCQGAWCCAAVSSRIEAQHATTSRQPWLLTSSTLQPAARPIRPRPAPVPPAPPAPTQPTVASSPVADPSPLVPSEAQPFPLLQHLWPGYRRPDGWDISPLVRQQVEAVGLPLQPSTSAAAPPRYLPHSHAHSPAAARTHWQVRCPSAIPCPSAPPCTPVHPGLSTPRAAPPGHAPCPASRIACHKLTLCPALPLVAGVPAAAGHVCAAVRAGPPGPPSPPSVGVPPASR
jgi:hypothetical protein